ncbi:MAG: FHA domain-containing protein [Nitrospirota bacterium]|nr:FHA domain-containing protein [Nitrospirota bacterium]MDH5586792.1 FHA domain-containing protein [Nitrospirota bacterium]
MSDDRTVQLSTYFPLTVCAEAGELYPGELRFIHSFRIGRSEDCEVRCVNRSVSRVHVDVLFENGQWWVQDHQSRNGTFVEGEKIDRLCLTGLCRVKLGKDGPTLSLQVDNLLEATAISTPLPPSDNTALAHPLSPVSFETPIAESSASQAPSSAQSENFDEAVSQQPLESPLGSMAPQNESPGPFFPEDPLGKDSLGHFTEPQDPVTPPPASPPSRLSRFGRKTPQESATQIFRNVLRRDTDSDAGPSTLIIRTALKEAFHQRSRRYVIFLSAIGLVAIFFGGVAWIQYLKVEGMKETASELFFSMKSMQLGLSQLENLVVAQLSPDKLQEILARREQLQAMEEKYEQFLEKIGVYSSSTSKEDRVIMRMARLFGECEIGMPPDFVRKVKSYINKWKTTDRLPNSIKLAESRGYGQKVSRIMLANHMPPQFFYLGLQESNFNIRAVGPPTRFGIAKGPWQFIPSTASEYGLQNGPLVAYEKYDPRDERHHFDKATQAAAKYLKHIYSTEAQASGLLVMASYNWGQTRVRKLIRQLPENPRERNFWELLKRFTIPQETYDYVFYIFSAAVIGENPALFGFSFQNPLDDVESNADS